MGFRVWEFRVWGVGIGFLRGLHVSSSFALGFGIGIPKGVMGFVVVLRFGRLYGVCMCVAVWRVSSRIYGVYLCLGVWHSVPSGPWSGGSFFGGLSARFLLVFLYPGRSWAPMLSLKPS